VTEIIVSVVIRAFNCDRYISLAIESVLAQTFQDFEIVVVDDASTDGTGAILEAYAQRDERVRAFPNETNQGPARAMNMGLRQAQGEFVAVQDGDDLSLPERLETQVTFLKANPDIALVGGGAYLMDEEGEEMGVGDWPRKRIMPEEVRQYLRKGMMFVHSSLMFRRECIEAIGFYDEFFSASHDYDMLIRMADKFDIVYYEEPLVEWRWLNSGITGSKPQSQAAEAELARARNKATKEGVTLNLQQEYNRLMAEGAIKSCRYRTNRPVSDAAYYYTMGLVLLESGKTRQARKKFSKALKHRGSINLRLRVLAWYVLSYIPNVANFKLVQVVRRIV